jgi:hypothetical protein
VHPSAADCERQSGGSPLAHRGQGSTRRSRNLHIVGHRAGGRECVRSRSTIEGRGLPRPTRIGGVLAARSLDSRLETGPESSGTGRGRQFYSRAGALDDAALRAAALAAYAPLLLRWLVTMRIFAGRGGFQQPHPADTAWSIWPP